MSNNMKNPNCFDHVGDQCIDVSVSSDSINIKAGEDSLASTLQKLIEQVECLKSGDCGPSTGNSSSTSSSDIGDLTLTNTPLSEASKETFPLTIIPNQNSTTVQYDLRNVLIDTKQDVINVEGFGSQNGVPSRLFRSSSSVATFEAKPENFPLTLSVEVTSLSAEGQKIMKFQKSINNASSSTNERMNVTDLTKASLTSQKDVNEFFDSKISSLNNKIVQMDNVDLNGTVGLNNILSDIQTQITNIQSTGSANTEELETSITSLAGVIESQQQTISDQNTAITNLQTQINVLRSAVGLG